MARDTKKPLDEKTLRRIAVAADCDPRTVLAVYLGFDSRRADARNRARRALAAEGLLPPRTEP